MSFIGSCFQTAIDRAIAGDHDYTITLESIDSEAIWIQLSWDKINAAYPFPGDPSQILSDLSLKLPPYVEVSEWSPQEFVTLEHSAEPIEDLVHFVEEYLRKALRASIEKSSFRIIEAL